MMQKLKNLKKAIKNKYFPVYQGGIVLFLFLLVSCTHETVEDIAETYPDGSPKIVRYYLDDGKSRTLTREITYYRNHQKYMEGEFKNNQRHGKWTSWYKNGNIWSEGYFTDGKDDGSRVVYHENGKKFYEGKYKDGKKTGKWKFWDEEGRLTKETDY